MDEDCFATFGAATRKKGVVGGRVGDAKRCGLGIADPFGDGQHMFCGAFDQPGITAGKIQPHRDARKDAIADFQAGDIFAQRYHVASGVTARMGPRKRPAKTAHQPQRRNTVTDQA